MAVTFALNLYELYLSFLFEIDFVSKRRSMVLHIYVIIDIFCEVAPNIDCIGLNNVTRRFEKRIMNGCEYSSGIRHSTALLLAIFLGWAGADRFYLGYYAIGFLKLFSFGCFAILYLIDIVLIALQLLGPANGKAYLIDYYGPKAVAFRFSNETYVDLYTCFDCNL
ncbi:unnamed protein product [Dracunculus medinensis]|uniref:TM2 domain-containing protein n=1 Tax=Dracunculus medinensis TaxID=318479 RepID=A0A0N4UJM8_DRAME|nr:unnamed protein product [Dracunculus medinensis]